MDNKHDFVQVKLENNYQPREIKAQKAMQFRIDQNKQVVVYNRVNNYILEAFLKAVFSNDA